MDNLLSQGSKAKPSACSNSLQSPSQERLAHSLQTGNKAELEWAPHFFRSLHWSFKPSTSYENTFGHFDFIATKNNRKLNVEVKAPKVCRNARYSHLSLVLSEYTGITGKPGWLRGEADVILQFLSEDTALAYRRDSMLHKFSSPSEIERFTPYNAPLSQWFGRTGLSRTGKPNQDIIRWDELSFYLNSPHSSLYFLSNNQWKKQAN